MEISNMKLDSDKLKAARISKGLFQKDIAELLGISAQMYSKKERGEAEFRLKEAIIISEFLEEPIKKIFCYDVENNSTQKAS